MREIVTIVIPGYFFTSLRVCTDLTFEEWVDQLDGSFRQQIGYMVITTDSRLTE